MNSMVGFHSSQSFCFISMTSCEERYRTANPASLVSLLNSSVRLRVFLQWLAGFILVLAALASLLLVAFAGPIVAFLSGAFEAAAPLVQILAVALFVMFLGNIFGFALVALQKQKQLLVLYALLALGNVSANLAFIPLYGAVAAAWTTVATETIAMAVAAGMVWRSLPYRIPWATLAATGFVSVATFSMAVTMPDTWHVLVRIGLAAGFFLLCAIAMGIVRTSHISLLLQKKAAPDGVQYVET
jgi:O-antigen/teichoic acid export membrane protein